MIENLQLNLPRDSKNPLYRQLMDLLLAQLEEGSLKPENKLPTVRELAQEMKLSNGTVKRAYDELERLGIIEKARRRGTFICSHGDEEKQGRKVRAMRIIDDLLDEMQELCFTLRETQIFLDLKMREREDMPRLVQVMAVDCNPEALSIISGQIARIRGTEVTSWLLDDLPNASGLPEKEIDIVVTTANHYERVAGVMRDNKVSRVVLSPTRKTIAGLVEACGGTRVGILTASERYAHIVRATRMELFPDGEDIPGMLFGATDIDDISGVADGEIGRFLYSLDTVIVPDQYMRFCSTRTLAAIRAFQEKGGSVIEFVYHIDAGSLMYLEAQIIGISEDKE